MMLAELYVLISLPLTVSSTDSAFQLTSLLPSAVKCVSSHDKRLVTVLTTGFSCQRHAWVPYFDDGMSQRAL